MNTLQEALRRIPEDMAAAKCQWALVGGFAVTILTEPRFTRDIDLVVSVQSDQEAELCISRLSNQGYQIEMVLEQDKAERLSTVRMIRMNRPGKDAIVDLLFASSGIENEIVAQANILEILPNLFIPVASRTDLIALKLLARCESRLQDEIDLQALIKGATASELEWVPDRLTSITKRGYNRGKNLLKEWLAILKQ